MTLKAIFLCFLLLIQGKYIPIRRLKTKVKRSVQYLNKYPDILLLDYTYKINKFDMPLLHTISIDHYGHTFTIALCFLDQEVEENYRIAIRFIRGLFGAEIWPSIIGTDRELTLISAIESQFPAICIKYLLYY